MAIDRRVLAAPVRTCTSQGWMLVPDALRAATDSSSRTVASGTSVGRNARTERRDVRAVTMAAWALNGMADSRFAGRIRNSALHRGVPELRSELLIDRVPE
jgi:hypothetical protein